MTRIAGGRQGRLARSTATSIRRQQQAFMPSITVTGRLHGAEILLVRPSFLHQIFAIDPKVDASHWRIGRCCARIRKAGGVLVDEQQVHSQ